MSQRLTLFYSAVLCVIFCTCFLIFNYVSDVPLWFPKQFDSRPTLDHEMLIMNPGVCKLSLTYWGWLGWLKLCSITLVGSFPQEFGRSPTQGLGALSPPPTGCHLWTKTCTDPCHSLSHHNHIRSSLLPSSLELSIPSYPKSPILRVEMGSLFAFILIWHWFYFIFAFSVYSLQWICGLVCSTPIPMAFWHCCSVLCCSGWKAELYFLDSSATGVPDMISFHQPDTL